MDIRRILSTPTRRLPSEIPETPEVLPIPISQLSTQSWDSQNGTQPDPYSVQARNDSQTMTITPTRNETSHDKRIQIQTALLFQVPYREICEKLNVTNRQILWAKNHRLTPQKACRQQPKLYTPQRRRLYD